MIKKILLTLSIIILFGCNKEEEIIKKDLNYNRSLYSWYFKNVLNDLDKFNTFIEGNKINRVYQKVSDTYLEKDDKETEKFIKDLNDKKIEVYYLDGEPSWGEEDGYKSIIEVIDKVLEFNSTHNSKFNGLLLDIEPYTSEKIEHFEDEHFEIYLKQIKKVYSYSKDKDIKILLAIPSWFDKENFDMFKELIKNCDGISVMNYDINNTVENIKNEYEYAYKYDKFIETIYEIGFEKDYTFNSFDEIEEDYKNIIYKYSNYVGLSYHHYGDLLKK